jgi:hypothetical protein
VLVLTYGMSLVTMSIEFALKLYNRRRLPVPLDNSPYADGRVLGSGFLGALHSAHDSHDSKSVQSRCIKAGVMQSIEDKCITSLLSMKIVES